MSDLYAIKASTLTAIGDAVRTKIIGTTELPIIEYPKTALTFMGAYSFEFPVSVKKIKITGKLEHDYTTYHTKLKGLGVAPIKSGSKEDVINDKGFVIVVDEVNGYEYGTNYDTDFEIIIDSNVFTFAAPTNENGTPVAYFSFTAIGLDENGNEFKYTPLEMADAINNIMNIPDEALTITGNCNYKFAYGGWDWFINNYGNKIITKDIYNANNMFINSTVKKIPFNINVDITTLSNICYIFGYMSNLEEVPYVIGGERTPPTSAYSGTIEMNAIFHSLNKVREIPNDFFWKMISNKEYWDKYREVSTRSLDYLFSGCRSLRELPDISMLGGAWTSQYSTIYSNTLYNCYALNTVENYPVCGKFSGNAMSNFVKECNRIKDLTFMTNEDGTPKTAQWKSQTLDLSSNIGYSATTANILNYNSGITADKQVKDDATYAALKDDPDWFTADINYSRYNHDSAVETINSLPDCSATGTNTIKFKGASGALTDGGAINSLTEEEIAVAAAKGWSVALV